MGELLDAIEENFAEQQDHIRLAETDSLELQKYRAVLQAEFEAARRRNPESVEFSHWQIPEEQHRGQFVVNFLANGRFTEGRAVRLLGDEEILGWSQSATGESDAVAVAVLNDKRKAFRANAFPHVGRLEAVPVDRELQIKIDAIENFLSAAAAETRSLKEQAAFTELRRELLGHFPDREITPAPEERFPARRHWIPIRSEPWHCSPGPHPLF